MSNDEFDPLRQMRPDRVEPDEPPEPTVFAREKERLMSTIGDTTDTAAKNLRMPDIYARLAYIDDPEHAIGAASFRRGAAQAFPLDRIGGLAQARRIDDADRQTVRQCAEDFPQRERAFAWHSARADARPPGNLQVGLARREDAAVFEALES